MPTEHSCASTGMGIQSALNSPAELGILHIRHTHAADPAQGVCRDPTMATMRLWTRLHGLGWQLSAPGRKPGAHPTRPPHLVMHHGSGCVGARIIQHLDLNYLGPVGFARSATSSEGALAGQHGKMGRPAKPQCPGHVHHWGLVSGTVGSRGGTSSGRENDTTSQIPLHSALAQR